MGNLLSRIGRAVERMEGRRYWRKLGYHLSVEEFHRRYGPRRRRQSRRELRLLAAYRDATEADVPLAERLAAGRDVKPGRRERRP